MRWHRRLGLCLCKYNKGQRVVGTSCIEKKGTKRTVAFTVEKQIEMNKPNGSVVVDEGLYHFGTKGGESHGANDGGTTTFGNAGGGGGVGVDVGGVGVGGDGGHVEGLVW